MDKQRRIAVMLDLECLYKRHSAVFNGTQSYARQRGWQSIIDEHVHDTLSSLQAETSPYDGIIARATRQVADHAARCNVPLVNVWFSSPVRDRLPGVFADFEAAGRMGAEHLLSRGFRSFAAAAKQTDRTHHVELEEFCRVVGEAGCACLTTKIPDSKQTLKEWRTAKRNMVDWMSNWRIPIGVFAGDAIDARIVVQLCHERGWRVPEDVAVISGDNEEMLCENPRPSLTSLESGQERIGHKAAQLLGQLMDEKEAGKTKEGASSPKHIFLPPTALIVRESTDFFSVNDELVASALAFIAVHGHRPISAADVARGVATSLRSLQRRFQKILGRPIAAQIRRTRIERAKRELTQSKLSIKSSQPASALAMPCACTRSSAATSVFRPKPIAPSDRRTTKPEPFLDSTLPITAVRLARILSILAPKKAFVLV
jgi:LacI family transcriptional regulator